MKNTLEILDILGFEKHILNFYIHKEFKDLKIMVREDATLNDIVKEIYIAGRHDLAKEMKELLNISSF